MTDVSVIEGLEQVGPELAGCVLTVGNFDGAHLGHQAILRAGQGLARQAKTRFCVLTFDPVPSVVLAPDERIECILPRPVSYRLLREYGADEVVVVKTTRQFLNTSPEDFVRDVVVGRLGPRGVVEGPEFFFGRRRGGTIQTLRQMAAAGGFAVHEVPPVLLELGGGEAVRVSSSLVRRLIREGDVAGAGRCLGRQYTLYGRVVRGEGRGRGLGFPTVNLEPAGVISPGDGVYAARATICSISTGETPLPQAAGGTPAPPATLSFPAAVSVGVNPTFGPRGRAIEANLIGGGGDFYGREIVLAFLSRLRDQAKFPDAESLRAQIAKDIQRVRELCG